MVGHLITIAENTSDHDLAWTVFQAYCDNKNLFTGSPGDDSMKVLVKGCLQRGNLDGAMNVVMTMNALEMVATSEAAQLILGSDTSGLSQSQRDKLATL